MRELLIELFLINVFSMTVPIVSQCAGKMFQLPIAQRTHKKKKITESQIIFILITLYRKSDNDKSLNEIIVNLFCYC